MGQPVSGPLGRPGLGGGAGSGDGGGAGIGQARPLPPHSFPHFPSTLVCCSLTMMIMFVGAVLLTGAYGPTDQVGLGGEGSVQQRASHSAARCVNFLL